MLINLQYKTLSARLNTMGAWLERFDVDGRPILFPRQTFELPDGSTKLRGGCHVCLPNFGPGGSSGLPQHGFGRELAWTVDNQAPTSVNISLHLTDGAYAGLAAYLEYSLQDNGLTMRLDIKNTAEKALWISPGFHPYFVAASDVIVVNGKAYDVQDLANSLQFSADDVVLQAGSKQYNLQATSLLQWVAWTDHLGDYVCIEPTHSAFSFSQAATKHLAKQLRPGEIWDCELTVSASME